MARPRKAGLDYFPMDVDYYDNFKIMDLMNRYGPLGTAVYQIVISKVYKNGYYLEVPVDKLAVHIVRIIGNRWIKNKDLVVQIIQYCAEIELFDNALLLQSVITSVGIQERYSEVTVRNKVDKSKYWLLEKNNAQAALDVVPENKVSVTETGVSAEKTSVNAVNIQQKESKEKESKLNESRENESRENESSAVLSIACTNGRYDITKQQLDLLQQTYKNIDVMQSLLTMADFANTHPGSQRPINGAEVWIQKWLTEDNNNPRVSKKKESNNVSEQETPKKKKESDTSYDISLFEKYDFLDF